MQQDDLSGYTSPSVRVEERRVEMSDGVSLRVIDFTPPGSEKRPVILFVAGWISLIDGWRGVLKMITPAFRTVYLETREKKSSQAPPGRRVRYDIDRMSADLFETVERLVPPGRPFVMAGSSLGATAILEYCAGGGRPPECAILIAPNADFRFPRFLAPLVLATHPGMYAVSKPAIKWYLRKFRIDMKNAPEQYEKYARTLDAADPYKLKANALSLRDYSIWERLGRVAVPCLIIGAAADKLHETGKLERMLGVLPRAEYAELASNTDTHSEKGGALIREYIEKKKYKKL